MRKLHFKAIWLCIATALLTTYCDKVYYYYTTSYIQEYYILNGINIKSDNSNKITLYPS